METILEGAADLDIDQRSPEDKPPTFMKNFSSEARVQPPHHAHEYVQVSDEPSELTVEQELAALEDEVAKRQQRIAELTQEKVFSADKIAHKAIGDLATTAGGAVVLAKLALELRQYLPDTQSVAKPTPAPVVPNIKRVTPENLPKPAGKTPRGIKLDGKKITKGEMVGNVLFQSEEPQHISVILAKLKQLQGWKGEIGDANSALASWSKQGLVTRTHAATWKLTTAGREKVKSNR